MIRYHTIFICCSQLLPVWLAGISRSRGGEPNHKVWPCPCHGTGHAHRIPGWNRQGKRRNTQSKGRVSLDAYEARSHHVQHPAHGGNTTGKGLFWYVWWSFSPPSIPNGRLKGMCSCADFRCYLTSASRLFSICLVSHIGSDMTWCINMSSSKQTKA